MSIRSFFLTVCVVLGLFSTTHAQMGFNTPAGIKLTEDFEFYSRNGFLAQEEYVLTTADPAATVRTMSCVTNPPAITALAGILKDPSGDASYSAGISYTCTQTISPLPVSGSVIVGIELQFEEFNMGFPGDRVLLTDGNGWERDLYTFNATTRVLVNGSSATIRFVTNSDADVGRGFRLRWRTLFR